MGTATSYWRNALTRLAWADCPLIWASQCDSVVSSDHVDLRIWLADLDVPVCTHQVEETQGWWRSQRSSEWLRASRMRCDTERRRFLASRLLLKSVLEDSVGLSGDHVHIVIGPNGKPALVPPIIHFNMSRRGRIAAIALSATHEVGVDLEPLRQLQDRDALAEAIFSPPEIASWAHVQDARRDAAFLLGWTRKEACLKAAGTGLSVDPKLINCGLTMGHTRVALAAKGQNFSIDVASVVGPGDVSLSCALVSRRDQQ